MNNTFIRSTKREAVALASENPLFGTGLLEEQMRDEGHVNWPLENISDYQLGFYELYRENEKLSEELEKILTMLDNPGHYRHDISQLAIMKMVRELRPPQNDTSKWQLLFETLLLPLEISGPILHLHYEGWELQDFDIYYWDQAAEYDPEMA